jgi:amino acid transporter
MSASSPDGLDDDVKQLHRLGYAQELSRRMSGFSNFAISLSIICILAGGITSFPVGWCSAGGASVGLGWPLVCLLALATAATMAQVASAYPTAGGLYHWSSLLGGRGWGWATAWFNLAGLISVLAAVNVATVQFAFGAFAEWAGLNAAEVAERLTKLVAGSPWGELVAGEPGSHWLLGQWLVVAAMTGSQCLFNHRGIRTTTRLTDFSGYLILGVSVVLGGALLLAADRWEWGRLLTLTNYTGPAGGEVWPETASAGWAFALGLLLPAYTITGFDASAHAAEETVGAAREVPRGIVRSVLVSALFGWFLLIALVLAIPDPDTAAAQGGNLFFHILEQRLPGWLRWPLLGGIVLTQYLCGLAIVTSGSRMVFAFARDGGLPWSGWLRRVSAQYRTPAAAIWITGFLGVLATGAIPYLALTAVCVVFLYVSYVMPTWSGLRAHGRTWTQMGPWHLGSWYRPLAVVSLLWGGALFVIGVQPPNQLALLLVPGLALVLAAYWWIHKRHHFAGPPLLANTAQPERALVEQEQALERGE